MFNKDEMVRLYKDKVTSCKEVARIIGCSQSYVSLVLREHNVKLTPHSFFFRDHIPWNKDLNGETTERIRDASRRSGETRKRLLREGKIDHPRGMLGKKASDQTKAKMSKSRLGRLVSQRTREKISKTLMNHGHSDETKNKISLNLKGRYCREEHRAWIDFDTNEITKLYLGGLTTGKIAKKFGVSRNVIYNRLRDYKIPIRSIKEERKKLVLPVKDTSIEVKIQNYLKQLGIEFFTHQYMKIEHGYQCDIFVPSQNLIIECDGDFFHYRPDKYVATDRIFKTGMTAGERWNLDGARTAELMDRGYKVLRLWEHEIKEMDLNKFKERLGKCMS